MIEVVALLILAPLFVFPPIGHPILTAILLLPCVWILAVRRGESILPRTELNGSLAMLTMMVLVSLYATSDVFFSAPKVLGVVFGLAVFFAAVRAIRDRRTLRNALVIFSFAGAALAIIGLLGTNWIDKMPLLQNVTAHLPAVIRGVPGQREGFQPNAIAGALVMFIPLQFALCVTDARMRAAHVAAFGVTSATLLLTQSRSGYLSLLAGIVLWLIWSGRKARRWTLAGVAAASAGILAFHAQFEAVLAEHVGSGVSSDVPGRLQLWARAIRMMQDFPLTGVGMNMFRQLVPAMYAVPLTPPEVDVPHAHNHLLQAGVDLGLPGLVAYLALWFGAAALLVRAHRMADERFQRWIAGGMAAGMIAYFAFGTADAIALGAKVGIFFWIALALVVSLHAHVEQTA